MEWSVYLLDGFRFPISTNWNQGLAISVMISNITIFLVHITISAFLLFFALRKIQPRADRRVFIGFALLFFCSGISYFVRALIFLWPLQVVVAVVSVLTAAVSVGTFSIWLPLAMSARDDLHQSNVEVLMRRLEEMQADLMKRERKIDELISEIGSVPRLSRGPDAK